MIITRTPFRVSFLGGGSDIPWFYENYGGGAVISTAINQYMYLTAHPMFDSSDVLLKYSTIEKVAEVSELKHPIAREVLSMFRARGLDISVTADIPAGTGLGSSSAFTVGLLQMISSLEGKFLTKHELAELACEIEIGKLGEPIGKQDQYASAVGGVNLHLFQADGTVESLPLVLTPESRNWLNSSMLLVRVDSTTRSASAVLLEQSQQAKARPEIHKSLVELRDLTLAAFPELQRDIKTLGSLMNESWDLKKKSSPGATNATIDDLIDLGLRNGALGAKLLGAGKGGFVLFIVEPEQQSKFIDALGIRKVFSIKTDDQGSAVVYFK